MRPLLQDHNLVLDRGYLLVGLLLGQIDLVGNLRDLVLGLCLDL